MNVQDAKAQVKAALIAGEVSTCPCCGQTCKLYRRKLNSGMVRVLIAMYRLGSGGRWVHINREIRTYARDYSYLSRWGLIEQDLSRGSGGFWRLTALGEEFVTSRGKAVPKYILMYNNKLLGFGPEETTIIQALGDKFDYRELMGS
ncbi:MAG: hypothetical protein KMY53_16050 [Desulfarculus sp.]|nr:hypothetical protein [Pseudomonadota bacterium]MBV1715472.1 hypothetical protein [Desulfarculus sp.]MBU4576222.1 hypothetical protein [Pseudomonadota bacterium]MBU4599260.1 hypothetical protein [Pseudomonadota bacterium]MBV1739681.1 hypothetical protein [Desulfarculus sp.]